MKEWMSSNPKHFILGENIILWQCIIIAGQRNPYTDEFHSIQEQLDNNIITLNITFHKEV